MKIRLLFLSLFAASSIHAQMATPSIPVDGYAAIVNDRVITVSDVMELIKPYERQLRLTYKGDELQERLLQVFREARDTLIEQQLILLDFASKEGAIPERMIDQRVDEIISERFENDRTKFLKALEEERITLQEWRDKIKDEMIVSILRRQEVNARIKISPSQVRKAYMESKQNYFTPEKVRLGMITLHKGDNPEENEVKLNEAQGLIDKINEGASFSDLAREYSEGSKASVGGDWGWMEPESLNRNIRKALEDLQPGVGARLVETERELYLVQLQARQEETFVPFEDVSDELEDELRRKEGSRIYEDWIARLRNKYTVKVY